MPPQEGASAEKEMVWYAAAYHTIFMAIAKDSPADNGVLCAIKSAAGIAAAVTAAIAAAAVVAVAAAAAQNDDQDNDPAAATAEKAIIVAHTRTS